MRFNNQDNRKGFSLVEILLVVTILGILAALVVPKFSSATDQAKQSAVKSILHTVRAQLENYKFHHGDYPTQTQMWDSMLNKTIADGTVDANGDFGP
ncbi:MAG: type II secretion system protein, partial [Planctomycetota bacterium]